MAKIQFTTQQRAAIEEIGGSVVVSAAAGSGKTAVLAERCAYLVCDAPPAERCDVDQLLVLTFGEAAASEMRERIVSAIQDRQSASPDDARLRRQTGLIHMAHISTIHAFCFWLVRRWFNHLGIDPGVALLDEDEVTLLKSEVVDAMFAKLYERDGSTDDPFGVGDLKASCQDSEHTSRAATEPGTDGAPKDDAAPTNAAFARLVDDYGLGEDREIARIVVAIYEFTESLPNPDKWLTDAVESVSLYPDRLIAEMVQDLTEELHHQADHCREVIETLDATSDASRFYVERIVQYAEHIEAWRETLTECADVLKTFESVRAEMASYDTSTRGAPRVKKDDTEAAATRDASRSALADVHKTLFEKRLLKRFALFTTDECLENLQRTAPFVDTLVRLVRAFRCAYAAKKRQLNGLDFSDLERFAFNLLNNDKEGAAASDVGRSVAAQFRYVLVDEFQDINPIQDAIIRLASRDACLAGSNSEEQRGNLFVVGDVKQSIYRFRMAEPGILNRRILAARGHAPNDGVSDQAQSGGVAIALQNNYRSNAVILEAVNVLFERLMRPGASSVVYDEQARLIPGRVVPNGEKSPLVELHLIEQSWRGADDDDLTGDEEADSFDDPARWTVSQREAYLIGTRLRKWMQSGELSVEGRPLRFGDVAILLRSHRAKAPQMASILAAMDIPVYADVTGSLFETREVRDVLAALDVLDNARQDIPLASLLRNGLLAEPFSEDDLVDIRCHDRGVSFHEAVMQYARDGSDENLRDRVASLVDSIRRYRGEALRRPVAELLWRLYEREGFLARVGGLSGGEQRRANLLKLYDTARQFGSFRRQGLHRFLRFVRSLENEDAKVSTAPAAGEGEDVVRIISVHRSKGLEFPVVFMAGLGSKINLTDTAGRMIYGREAGIGFRVVDTNAMIEYPSVAHSRVVAENDRTTRDEELRLLYVATTRARDKLVMVASAKSVATVVEKIRADRGRDPSLLDTTTASTWLQLVLLSLRGAPAGCVGGWDEGGGRRLFDVRIHAEDELAGWSLAKKRSSGSAETAKAVAQCAPLPASEPLADGDSAVDDVLAQLDYVYPALASASVPAAVAASDFKRSPAHEPPASGETSHRQRDDDFHVPPSKYSAQPSRNAMHRGVVTHSVLQHLNFAVTSDADGVARELRRMLAEGLLTEDDRLLIDEESLAWFSGTPLADSIRSAGDAYRREFMYVATEPLEYFDPSIGPTMGDRVLVRGVVDGLFPSADDEGHANGMVIVDFKTDALSSHQVADRAASYRRQLELYARAVSRMWRVDVHAGWLVFLGPRQMVSFSDLHKTLGETG